MLDVTSTNAIIQKVNDPDSEKLNVSLQRLSKCDRQLSEEVPWMGHGRSRRRRQIRKTARPNSTDQSVVSETQQQSTNVAVTRRGRVIRPSARFNEVASPNGSAKKGGGKCGVQTSVSKNIRKCGSREGQS